MSDATTRREFLTAAAGAVPVLTAASYGRILGSNDRIRLGVVGPGQRGINRMLAARAQGAEIVALADCNRGLLELALGRLGGAKVSSSVDYRDLLARSDVDGVINATPDHLHHRVILDTVAAGKDLYTEKPLARTIAEGSEIVEKVAASKAVVQVGNQRRKAPHSPVDLAHRVLVGAHLANEAYRSGQRVDWDPVRLKRISRRDAKS